MSRIVKGGEKPFPESARRPPPPPPPTPARERRRSLRQKVAATRRGAVAARRAHNPKVGGSTPPAATNEMRTLSTKALVIWGLVVFAAGIVVGELLMLASMAFGSCR